MGSTVLLLPSRDSSAAGSEGAGLRGHAAGEPPEGDGGWEPPQGRPGSGLTQGVKAGRAALCLSPSSLGFSWAEGLALPRCQGVRGLSPQPGDSVWGS